MQRYILHISYNGSPYRGWQKQAGIDSVQETLENSLSLFFGEKMTAIGCGRTDAGVHAAQYILHFDTSKTLPENSLFKLNKMLPYSISIHDILPAEPNFHAQFSAKERTYDYFIHTTKDPFLADVSALYMNLEIDVERIQKAVAILASEDFAQSETLTNISHDFRAFCLTPEKHTSTLCTIKHCSFKANDKGDKYQFTITADRFLRGMVRIIVGKLIEIGTGRMSLNEFEHHLETGESFQFMNQAYPQGLYLSKIVYPDLDFERKGILPEF